MATNNESGKTRKSNLSDILQDLFMQVVCCCKSERTSFANCIRPLKVVSNCVQMHAMGRSVQLQPIIELYHGPAWPLISTARVPLRKYFIPGCIRRGLDLDLRIRPAPAASGNPSGWPQAGPEWVGPRRARCGWDYEHVHIQGRTSTYC